MTTRYRNCFYDNIERPQFSNLDYANDFVNHIPEVISGERSFESYKVYYCPKCLAWHITDLQADDVVTDFPNNNDIYEKTVEEYKKKCKPVIETEESKSKIQPKKDVYTDSKDMINLFIGRIEKAYDGELDDKSPLWIREACNYVYRYINYSLEEDNSYELDNAYSLRDQVYDKSIDLIFLLFSEIDNIYNSGNKEKAYKLYFNTQVSITYMNEKLFKETDIYDIFNELITINNQKFEEISYTANSVQNTDNHFYKAKKYTELAKYYCDIKYWSIANDNLLKALKELTRIEEYKEICFYDESIKLIDILQSVEKKIKETFEK